ncbi:hypothetical protein [Candidatus Formimonas warabiya]|uniref:DUF1440 domain-containing protein n=1 Tax=Formimonas warabiya TaxID=1761012 RepID=A0A3G1KN26_FORW1|nr:hypothetical protein [Candidatus Formimonas warabiya]ATW23857.1 hypothetical protein DCMF_02735 [Candidatus Formimonas warabiya]
MNLNDRMTIGFVSGVIGGIAMLIPDFILYRIGVSKTLFLDWSSVLMYGHITKNISEAVLAEASHLVFTGFLGIFFVFLVFRILNKQNYFLKGLLYSLFVWFTLNALSIFFYLPGLSTSTLGNVITDIIGSAAYGLVLAAVSKWIYERTKLT